MTTVLWTIAAAALLPLALVMSLPAISELWGLIAVGWRGSDRTPPSPPLVPRQRLLVLVAAHNEELLIGAATRSFVAMRREACDYDLFVIADNCTDATAEIAAAEGARVLVRHDLERRGKPWALLWAMRELPVRDYDAVVIVDADTIADPGFADGFARRGPLRDKAVQSYSAISNERDSWLTILGALLVSMRYDGQYALKERTGLSCPIGNAWCVGSGLLARGGWAPTALTETWELYARYTALGVRVDFAADAVARSQEARTLSQGAPQRRRWQAGKRTVFRRYWRRLLVSDIGLHQKLDAFGELAATGPVLHASFAVPLTLVFAAAPTAFAHVVAALFAFSLAPTAGWTVFAWWRQPNRAQVAFALARLPLYAAWRIVVALEAFGTARRGVWHRSPRHQSINGSVS